ncbi:MAG: four helix bundle protein [Acidobacteria bacterium]|nr:four helix bundle protein [Acidobacteriota bacterium]
MAGVKTFEELVAWQQAREVKKLVYALADKAVCRREPDFRRQIRDAAASVPANIAEGFARKRPRDFSRFLTIARASLAETQNHLIDGIDRGLWNETELDGIRTHLKRAGTAIAGLQTYLNSCSRLRLEPFEPIEPIEPGVLQGPSVPAPASRSR